MKIVFCEEKNVRKQIDVTDEVRAKIRKIFGCSNPTMWRALSYHSDTDTSRRIRKCAMENGGVLMLLSPAMETIHSHEGCMRQYFASGAMLEADKRTGMVRVYDSEGTVRRVEKVMGLNVLESMQVYAEGLA